MKKFLFKFWPVVFIFIIWFIFAHPYFLKNKVPFPSTYQVNNFAPWSAEPRFAGPVKNGAMPDIITQIYPWRNLVIETWKQGEIPLWNPYSFSGTPLLANYQSAALSPFNVFFFILPFVDSWSILVLIQPLLAGIFMYLFTRSLKRSKVGSLIASISFMFCGFITVWMGYATLPFAILFLPLALFCIEKYLQTIKTRYLLFLSLSIPLSFFSGHFQISLYFLIFTCSYIIYKLFSEKKIITTIKLLFAVFIGLLMSMPQLIPSIELYLQSYRSLVFAKGEVIPWGYISTFLSPDFLGNPVTRNDWFGHYAEWNAYIGVLPLMLAVYSVLSKRNTQAIFLFIFGMLVLCLAFPTPLQDLFVNLHIPVLSTSAASRIIVIFSFAFATLCAFGFDQLLLDIKSKKNKKVVLWIASFSIIFIILWVIVLFKLFIPVERIIVAKNNLILPTIIFAASVFIILITSLNRKLLTVSVYILLLLVSFDMLRFAIKWMPFDPKELVFPQTSTTKSFKPISGHNRVFGNLGGEASMYYHLPSVEGYDALYIKRYGEFINFIADGKLDELNRSVVIFSKTGKHISKAINLLDIKYIVHKVADDHAVWTFPYWTYPKDQFKLIYKDNMYEFYENTNVFPHAFLVGEYKIITQDNKAIEAVFAPDLDLRKEIILEKDPGIGKSNDPGEANIVSYTPNNIEIDVNAKNESLLFLASNYYPGWKASIDGKEIPVLKANYTFKAIPVQKGKYAVKLSYDPWSFRLGVYLAIIGLMGLTSIILLSRNKDRLKSISA